MEISLLPVLPIYTQTLHNTIECNVCVLEMNCSWSVRQNIQEDFCDEGISQFSQCSYTEYHCEPGTVLGSREAS